MKPLPLLLAAFSAACCAAAALPATAGEPPYARDGATTRPGIDTGYDYVDLGPGTGLLFVARHADDPIVFDVDANQRNATLDNSPAANRPVSLPDDKRGHAAMHDSSLFSSDPQTLKRLVLKPLATRRPWRSLQDVPSLRFRGADLHAALRRTGDLTTAAADRSGAGVYRAGTSFR